MQSVKKSVSYLFNFQADFSSYILIIVFIFNFFYSYFNIKTNYYSSYFKQKNEN